MSTTVDFTGNGRATLSRRRKAKRLADWCEENRHDPAVIVDPAQRRQIERAAGVRRCSDATWDETVTVFYRRRDRRVLGLPVDDLL